MRSNNRGGFEIETREITSQKLRFLRSFPVLRPIRDAGSVRFWASLDRWPPPSETRQSPPKTLEILHFLAHPGLINCPTSSKGKPLTGGRPAFLRCALRPVSTLSSALIVCGLDLMPAAARCAMASVHDCANGRRSRAMLCCAAVKRIVTNCRAKSFFERI